MARREGPSAEPPCGCPDCRSDPGSAAAEEHRAIRRLMSVVDERARRLLAGLLALQHGRGGVTLVARITGLSRATVQRGQRELQEPEPADPGRVRRPGGGRKAVEKNVRTW